MSRKQEEQVQILPIYQKKYNPITVLATASRILTSFKTRRSNFYFKSLKKMQHAMPWQNHQFFLFLPQIKATIVVL